MCVATAELYRVRFGGRELGPTPLTRMFLKEFVEFRSLLMYGLLVNRWIQAAMVSGTLTLGTVAFGSTVALGAANGCVPAAVNPSQFVVGGQFDLASYAAAVAAANLACSGAPLVGGNVSGAGLPTTGSDSSTILQVALGMTALGAAAVGTAAVRRRRPAGV